MKGSTDTADIDNRYRGEDGTLVECASPWCWVEFWKRGREEKYCCNACRIDVKNGKARGRIVA
jgi:hypothetical protein